MCACMCKCVCACVCVCARACVRAHARTYAGNYQGLACYQPIMTNPARYVVSRTRAESAVHETAEVWVYS